MTTVATSALHQIIDNFPDALLLVNAAGEIVVANAKAHHMLGLPLHRLTTKHLSSITNYNPEDIDTVLFSCMRSRSAIRLGVKFEINDYLFNEILIHGSLFSPRNENEAALILLKLDKVAPQINRFFSLNREIEQQNKAMRMLTENRDSLEAANRKIARYVELVDKHIITSSTNRFGRITEVSEAFCKISKYSKYELIGRSHNIVRHPDMPASLYEDMWQTISSGKYWQGEIKNRAKDGSAYWVDVNIEPIFSENDEILGYTAIRQDITDKKRIEEISVTDSLTGLYNRMRLDQEVAAEIERANRYATTFSIILFDLDHFKRINDSCGHLVGDSVLEEIGRIMQERVRQVDLAGRWGGEEFMVICPGVNMTGANTLAEDLRQHIASHNFQKGEKVTASFGVAEYLPNESNIEMVNRVDQALYQAKTSGRNRVYCARANVDIGIA